MREKNSAAPSTNTVHPPTPRRAAPQLKAPKAAASATASPTDHAWPGWETSVRLRAVMARNDGVSQKEQSANDSAATPAARSQVRQSCVSQKTAQVRMGKNMATAVAP